MASACLPVSPERQLLHFLTLSPLKDAPLPASQPQTTHPCTPPTSPLLLHFQCTAELGEAPRPHKDEVASWPFTRRGLPLSGPMPATNTVMGRPAGLHGGTQAHSGHPQLKQTFQAWGMEIKSEDVAPDLPSLATCVLQAPAPGIHIPPNAHFIGQHLSASNSRSVKSKPLSSRCQVPTGK